jgi:signal peptide peptidase SppA
MPRSLLALSQHLYNTPLLLLPDKAAIIHEVISPRVRANPFQAIAELSLDGVEMAPAPLANAFVGSRHEKGGFRVEHGVAIVPVVGTLVNRGAWVGASSGLTSYEGLTKQLKEADKDGQIRGILLDIDSPGGEAGGCFELAALIREIRARKPVVAHANTLACSAAYAIASAADRIFATSTSVLGSIGVVMIHWDRSKYFDEEGVKPTMIMAGARKGDGNSFGPLPKDVKERLQAEAEKVREQFIAEVVAGRPQIKPAAVRETEAGVYMGAEAVKMGLADEIATFDRVLEHAKGRSTRLPTPPAGYTPPKMENPMTETAPAVSAPAAAAAQPSEAALATARAEGRASERARTLAILRSSEAEGRYGMAVELIDAGLEAEKAVSVLASAPKAAAGGTANQLYAAVAAQGGTPKVRHEGAGGAPAEDPVRLAMRENMKARVARMSGASKA